MTRTCTITQPSSLPAPTTLTCPPGLVPVLGATLTCEAPPQTLTCPVGTHPVLRDMLTCEPN